MRRPLRSTAIWAEPSSRSRAPGPSGDLAPQVEMVEVGRLLPPGRVRRSGWDFRRQLPKSWVIRYGEFSPKISPTDFKHTGLFPRAGSELGLVFEKIRKARAGGEKVSVLNLFGYTEAATIALRITRRQCLPCRRLDGMVQWCRDNATLSGLTDKKTRYIVDDAMKFVAREATARQKRNTTRSSWTHPPTDAVPVARCGSSIRISISLLDDCRQLLGRRPLFFLINSYASRLAPLGLSSLLPDHIPSAGGKFSVVANSDSGAAATGKFFPAESTDAGSAGTNPVSRYPGTDANLADERSFESL